MFCSKCATKLSPGSHFCLRCGEPSTDNASASNSVPVFESVPESVGSSLPRPRPRPRFAAWILIALLLAMVAWIATSDHPVAGQLRDLATNAHSETIVEATVPVPSHNFAYYKFTVPPGAYNVVVNGTFTAAGNAGGGASNDVQVSILTDAAFVTWRSGFSSNTFYDSGRITQGDIEAELPSGAGAYYLVFDNKFSLRAGKSVQSSVSVRYRRWWPAWLQSLKEEFSL